MSVTPTQLLQRLGAGVRPDGSTASGHARTAIDSASFGDMLARVQQGEVESQRPITIAGGIADKVTLTDEQLARVATATDAAEAAGATRIVAVVGGQALLVDVLTRTVEQAGPASSARMVTGVDGVVFVPEDPAADMTTLFGAGSEGARARDVFAGLRGSGNRSVATLVASMTGGTGSAEQGTAA